MAKWRAAVDAVLRAAPWPRLPRAAPRSVGALIAVIAALAALAATAAAGPTVGFREEFSGAGVTTWGGGTPVSNPGTGGVLGDGDGYLLLSNPLVARFGTRSTGPEYSGNWRAAGITQVRVWLDDVGADEPFEIHVGLGTHTNFWHYKIGFIPPNDAWGEFVADINDAANWVQTLGTGAETFEQALATVDHFHFRHDLAPIEATPDPIAGDLGIDHILLTDGIVGVGDRPRAVGRPVALAAPYPNPARGPVAFALETFDAGPVRIRIVDAAGRVVRSAELAAGLPGHRVWTWDGRDDGGREAAPGVYRVRAVGRAGGTSRAFVRVR